jgi:RNA polymerase sigma factor (sigma-70 family)
VSPTRDLETLDSSTGFDQASERAAADEESRLVTQALAALPDRDQVVLWLLEVEDKSLRTAAKALGLKPNNVAQIAMRARRRLRREYVHAHLRNDVAGT